MFTNLETHLTSSLRKQALLIAEAGLAMASPERLLEKTTSYDANTARLQVGNNTVRLAKAGRISLVGIGSGSSEAVMLLRTMLHASLEDTLVLSFEDNRHPDQTIRVTPHPSAANVAATDQLLEFLKASSPADTIVLFQGADADLVVAEQPDTPPHDQRTILEALANAGAAADEIALVAGHLSHGRSGDLIRLLPDCPVIGLVCSNQLNADGQVRLTAPTVRQSFTAYHAQQVLERYNILAKTHIEAATLVEPANEDKYFQSVTNLAMASPYTALSAMREKAEGLGYDNVVIYNQRPGDPLSESALADMIVQEQRCVIIAGVNLEHVYRLIQATDKGGVAVLYNTGYGQTSWLTDLAAGMEPDHLSIDAQTINLGSFIVLVR